PGATSYTVNIFTGSSCTGSPSSSPSFPGPPPLTVPGLTNGQQYCFQVTAIAGGVTSTPSNAVTATPGAATTYQTINVSRPEGNLVLSQRCAGIPTDSRLPNFDPFAAGQVGDFDPANANAALTPESRCAVTLSGPRLNHLVTDVITAQMRTVHDNATTFGNATVSSQMMAFVRNDIYQFVVGTGIPAGTRIIDVAADGLSATLSQPANATVEAGDLTILGRTVRGTNGQFAGTDLNHEVSGRVIPGGSMVTSAASGIVTPSAGTISIIDLSQPANYATNPGLGDPHNSIRMWDEAPRPARLITDGPQDVAGRYLEATGRINQVYAVDYRSDQTHGWTAGATVGNFCDGNGAPGGTSQGNPNAVTGSQNAHNLAAAAPDECLSTDTKVFSGNQLAIQPHVRFASGSLTFAVTH